MGGTFDPVRIGTPPAVEPSTGAWSRRPSRRRAIAARRRLLRQTFIAVR